LVDEAKNLHHTIVYLWRKEARKNTSFIHSSLCIKTIEASTVERFNIKILYSRVM